MKLGTYMRIRSVMTDEKISDHERSMAIVSIVKNITPKELRQIPVGQYDDLAKEVTDALDIKEVEIKDEYMIGGIKCRLHRTVNSMTAIQFSDLINTIKAGDNDKNMPTILSILLVPVGSKYPDYDRHDLEEKIVDDLDVADAMSIANFIRGLSHVSQRNIVTSLILNERTAWAGVPRWRRALARTMLNALLIPSPRLLARNGGLLSGLSKSPRSNDVPGRRRND